MGFFSEKAAFRNRSRLILANRAKKVSKENNYKMFRTNGVSWTGGLKGNENILYGFV
jgi:hypothetical protein